MNKLFVFFGCILFCTTVCAQCPFTDRFQLEGPNEIKLLSGKAAGNIQYENQDDYHFTLSCKNNDLNTSGYLYIDIGYHDSNKCSLVIHDGPYVLNPSVVSIQCGSKMSYAGLYHHVGSYEYILKFID